jgi:transposase InsO family protein
MAVMDVFTRRIIGFGVERADLCGVSVCRMFNQIIAGKSLPRHLSSDHDPLFRFHRWLANLRILEVEEIKSIPYAPMSHPFVERLIGTIRREWAVVASLLATAKLNDVEPFAYLKDVLDRMSNGHPMSRLDHLLPWNWTPSIAAAA